MRFYPAVPESLRLPMLVCQCNVITDKDIKQIILGLLRDDPWQIIVPAMVYRELNKRCKCAGCVPNVVDIILAVTEEYHLQLSEQPPAEPHPVHARLSAMRRKRPGGRNERRSAGHRAA